MIGIVDYGVGNLFSLKSSIEAIGEETIITSDKNILEKADKVILPGVGAFGDAVLKLQNTGLDKEIIRMAQAGRHIMGICLGMQLLFEKSYEYGEHEGLGLIKGKIASIQEDLNDKTLKVPHIGWNSLQLQGEDPLFQYIKDGDYVYYVHSFYGKNCTENTIATSNYDITITGAVRSGSVYGTQFHPEKSGEVGLNILKAFMEL